MSNEEIKTLIEQEANAMPCGSNHSCFDCTHWYYFDCSHIERMSEPEYDNHTKKLYLKSTTQSTESGNLNTK